MHLDRSTVGLEIDDVADLDLFLLQALVDGRVELELLRSLDGLEAENDVRDRLAIAAEGRLRLLDRHLNDLALVDLLGLLDAQPDRSPEILHEDLCLFHFGRVHLAPNHRAERNPRTELLCDRQRNGRLAY